MNNAFVFVAVGIRHPNTNDTIGVLASRYSLLPLQQTVQLTSESNIETLLLVNSSGQIIASSDSAEYGRPVPETIMGRIPLADRIFEPDWYLGEDLHGQPAVLGFAPLTNTARVRLQVPRNLNWAVIVSNTQSNALVEVTNTVKIATLVGLLATAFGVTFAIWLAWITTQPINALTQTAVAITGGDLDRRAAVAGAKELQTLSEAFNTQTARLRELIDTLEARVVARTRDLQVAADVSREATTVLDLNVLLPRFVELTQTGFEMSHIAVFFFDRDHNTLKLAATTGNESSETTIPNTEINVASGERGLLAEAVRQHKPIIVNDVSKDTRYKDNSLVFNTRSEAVFPMLVGNNLIGMLDLKSDQLDRFSDDDIRVLTTLAEQMAVAVRNAQLYAESQDARQDAEKANLVKSQFLAAMSHELRTPLNAILNFTDFVASGMLGDVNEEQVDILGKVRTSGKHLLSLINDVLDISKIESGALRLFVEPDVNLNAETQSVVDSAHVLLGDKPIKLVAEIDANTAPIVADRRRVRQIMLNLVSNACKFTEEGEIRISLQQNGDHALFAVHDTGPGIAPEDHETVFETFQQSEAGLRQGEGTGLGLPISRRLAELHGGRLWLNSVPGEGASFYVSLPTRSEELLLLVNPKKTQKNREIKNGK